MSPYPKYKYHATEPPKQVKNEAEEQALGPEWQDTYIKQDYPKAKYKAKSAAKAGEPTPYDYAVVANPEEESKLGGGWSDKPPEAHAHAAPVEESKAPPKK